MRPTDLPRLSQIDPERLAREIERRMRDHIHSQAIGLGVGTVRVVEDESRQPGQSDLGLAVHVLATYARNGLELDAPVQEYLITLIPLWSSALGDAPSDIDGEADPATPLGVVMLAALAREAIGQGRAVSARELAALGDCSAQHVRMLARRGELEMEDGEIPAEVAQRWLSARGVPGI